MAKKHDLTVIKDLITRTVMSYYFRKNCGNAEISKILRLTDRDVDRRIIQGRSILNLRGGRRKSGPKKGAKPVMTQYDSDFLFLSRKTWKLTYLPFGQWGD